MTYKIGDEFHNIFNDYIRIIDFCSDGKYSIKIYYPDGMDIEYVSEEYLNHCKKI